MIVCDDLKSLEAAIMAEIAKAMNDASKEIKETMDKEVQGFYTKGEPKMYKRTFKLKETPKVSDISISGNTASFNAYLDLNYTYPSITYTYYDGHTSTSKSPTMTDVVNLTNYGTTSSSVGTLHPALGKRGYWERSTKKMQRILEKNVRKHFHQ